MSNLIFSINQLKETEPNKNKGINKISKWWLLKKSRELSGLTENTELNTKYNYRFKTFEIKGNSIQGQNPSPTNEMQIKSCAESLGSSNLPTEYQELDYVYNTQDKTRIYKTKYAQDGIEIEAIPCYRKIDNVCGIYFIPIHQFFADYDPPILEKGNEISNESKITFKVTNINETKEQTINLTMQESFKSIGIFRDSFEKIDGQWYEKHIIKRVYFDGTERGAFLNGAFYTNIYDYLRQYDEQTTMCNYFQAIKNTRGINDIPDELNNICTVRTYEDDLKYLYIVAKDFRNINEFQNWVSKKAIEGSPLYIDYVLDEDNQYLLPCTEEQSQVLETLKNLRTYSDGTKIICDDTVSPNFVVEYVGEPIVQNDILQINRINIENEIKEYNTIKIEKE